MGIIPTIEDKDEHITSNTKTNDIVNEDEDGDNYQNHDDNSVSDNDNNEDSDKIEYSDDD
jgi:hypothetical protein